MKLKRQYPSILTAAVLFTLCLLFALVDANEKTHVYSPGEQVVVWANKVGPYFNPQETYDYLSLPFCRAHGGPSYKEKSLGDSLNGHTLSEAQYNIYFSHSKESTEICSIMPNQKEVEQFKHAIFSHYWYQFYMDDLPVTAPLGEVRTGEMQSLELKNKIHSQEIHANDEPLIYTHQSFRLGYFRNNVISIDIIPENPVLIQENTRITFTYSVRWHKVSTTFEQRLDRFFDPPSDSLPRKLALLNSLIMVIILITVVVVISMRMSRSMASKLPINTSELDDETTWKNMSPRVLRSQTRVELFSALLGIGIQLFVFGVAMMIVHWISRYYTTGKITIVMMLTIHTLTSLISGLISGAYYTAYGRGKWQVTIILTFSLFFGLVVGVYGGLNLVAALFESTAAISFGTILLVISVWLAVAAPVTFVGTSIGRRLARKYASIEDTYNPILPTRSSQTSWYKSPIALSLGGGLLPFLVVVIELLFFLKKMWSVHMFQVTYFFTLSLSMSVVTVCCTSVYTTYTLLRSGDYRWVWTSWGVGFSIGIYTFIYSLYFFIIQTSMNGVFQVMFYFGNMFVLSCVLGFVFGSLSFASSWAFVEEVFSSLKND